MHTHEKFSIYFELQKVTLKTKFFVSIQTDRGNNHTGEIKLLNIALLFFIHYSFEKKIHFILKKLIYFFMIYPVDVFLSKIKEIIPIGVFQNPTGIYFSVKILKIPMGTATLDEYYVYSTMIKYF